MASRKLHVEIIGDSDSLRRAFGQSATAATGFGRSMSRMGRTVKLAALGASAAIAGGLVVTLKRGFDELSESQKVSAQTAAAIKSTGAAAKVTAGQVEELAGALSRKTGIDDEAIQAGENLLLTFKNVRNEVGKGNDVFNKATQAAVDLSVAGFGSLESSSKMMGKALNDPIKGMTALGRAGVTFSDDQKKAIKAMVETGNILGAQKLILKEVESQVGGSAKAYGETLPGQLSKLRNAFDELAGRIATKLLPVLTQAVDWVNAHWPQISTVFESVSTRVFAAVGGVASFIREHWPQISATFEAVSAAVITSVSAVSGFIREQVIPAVSAVVEFVRANWPQISATAKQVFSDVSAVISGTVTVIRALWSRFGADILASTRAIWNQVSGQIEGALEIIRGIVKIVTALLHGDFSKAWDGIKQVFSGALTSIAATLRGMVTIWGTIAKALGKAILDGVSAGLTALAGLITRELGKLAGVLSRTAGQALSQAAAIGQNIIDGIVNGMAALVQKIKGKLDDLWGIISNVAGLAAGAAVAIGQAIISGIISGLGGLVSRVAGAVAGGIKKGLSSALSLVTSSPEAKDAVPIGTAIMAGVIKGVRDNLPSASRVIAEVTKQAVERAGRTNFGKWLGENLVKGLTKALTDEAKQVAGAAGSLVSGAKGAALKGLNDVGQAIVAAAKKYGVDARAALAVAMGEGGVKFGAVGDSGTSFGPFQLHIGGASPSSDPKKAAEFANSIRGIEYAIRKMAQAGAAGKSGFDAINAIIRNFERPLDPDSSVRNAVARYATIPAAIGAAVTSAGPVVGSAVQAQLAQIAAKVQQVAPTIGLAKARGIVAGFLQAAPTLTQQITQALSQAATEAIQAAAAKVKEARGALSSAFGELSSAALAAFDANVAKWKSPAETMLSKFQRGDQIKQMLEALRTQMAGPEGDPAAVDPATVKAKQAEILAAIKSGDQARIAALRGQGEAERALVDFYLNEKTVREQAAHAKAMERRRVQFENQLTQAQTWINRHPEAYAEGQRRIQKVLDEFVPKMQRSGAAIGAALAQGMESSIDAVEAAAKKLAAAAGKYLKMKSPAEAGPLASVNTWWKGLVPALLSSVDMKDLNRFFGSLGSAGMPALAGGSGMPGGGMAMAGGGGAAPITVNVYPQNMVSTKGDLVRQIRDELVQRGVWNGGGMLAGQG